MPLLADDMKEDSICNDVHSKLNATRVARIIRPVDRAGVVTALKQAEREGSAVSLCGARHSMGGQQFGKGTVLLDLTGLDRVSRVDCQRGTVEAGAGVRWPDLIEALHRQQDGREQVWSIRQKQTGADHLTLGGSLSSNIHGRGLTMRPIIEDVEAFTLVGADGTERRCSRAENRELFCLAIGGYGCFGVITSVCLRLAPQIKLQRLVEITTVDKLVPALDQRVADGCRYGDFQFSIDERSADFLFRGVLSTYRPAAPDAKMPTSGRELGRSDWEELIRLAHTDRAKVFEVYSDFYLSTHGALYWSDTHQLGLYPEDYHGALDRELGAPVPGSEMITELYVPRGVLPDFMAESASALRSGGGPVIYGTVRLIRRDQESFLAWARADYACIVYNLHVDHSETGLAASADAFRTLIDLALSFGGSYFLTYHRWARRDQVERAYPRFGEFLQAKEKHDPAGRFQSEWWRHYRDHFERA